MNQLRCSSGRVKPPLLSGAVRDSWPRSARIVQGQRDQRRFPKELQAILTRLGGLNRFDEPNYRGIWGWEPTEFVFTKALGYYELRPKYPRRNRFYIERWHPPEEYGTPDTWERQWTERIDGRDVHLLGPFPTRGCYEHLLTVERAHKDWCSSEDDPCRCGGGFVSLNPSVVEDVVYRIFHSQGINAMQRRSRVYDQIDKEANDTEPNSEEDALIDDYLPAFGSRAHVALGNNNRLPVRGVLQGESE